MFEHYDKMEGLTRNGDVYEAQGMKTAWFKDPDGNGWVLQEITTRFPGRIDSNATTFASAADLASAMRRAEAAHGEHEAAARAHGASSRRSSVRSDRVAG